MFMCIGIKLTSVIIKNEINNVYISQSVLSKKRNNYAPIGLADRCNMTFIIHPVPV